MGMITSPPMETLTTDYKLILEANVEELVKLKALDSQLEFDELLKLSFEKMLYLKSEIYVYEYLYDVIYHTRKQWLIQPLLRQAFSTTQYVDLEFRHIVNDIVFNSLTHHCVEEVKFDPLGEFIFIRFSVL